MRNLIFFLDISGYYIWLLCIYNTGILILLMKSLRLIFFKGGGVTYFAGPVAGSSGDTPAGWGNSGG